MSQQTYYYEVEKCAIYLLCEGGVIREFQTTKEMYDFVDDTTALFIEVTPNNWDELYEQGAFF